MWERPRSSIYCFRRLRPRSERPACAPRDGGATFVVLLAQGDGTGGRWAATADAEGVTVLVSGAPSPERALDSARAAEKVESALSALPREREQAVRAHLAGFTVAELMALHDWPYHKARNLIARGLADLRELLRAAGIDRA